MKLLLFECQAESVFLRFLLGFSSGFFLFGNLALIEMGLTKPLTREVALCVQLSQALGKEVGEFSEAFGAVCASLIGCFQGLM